MNYYPQTDVNGRNTGKELKDGDNNKVYAEYIYYRKVGDHGTNMPSSVYFGKTKNNRFSVSDNIKYKYDEMGNISEVRENGVLTAKYTYDRIGRLIREDNRKFGKSVFISYDNCGNILSKREAQFTLKPADEIEAFTDEKMYAYNGDKLLSFGDEILFYTDTEGKEHVNPLIYRGQQLSWSFERRLASFGENTFVYDGYGRRIKKNNTVFTYDANNKLVKQSDGSNTLEFVYDNNGLSGVKHNDKEYIYSKDIQGNIISILDKSGREVVQYKYDAWGNVITEVIDEAHAGIAELNPFRYRSYYYDTETNLYYLNTRYYDPETGRFISQDDVSYLDPEHINGLNLFAYCGNNPVMQIDPNGHIPIANFLTRVQITNMIWGFDNIFWGRINYSVTQLAFQSPEEIGLFYAHSTVENEYGVVGIGINLCGWLGININASGLPQEYNLSLGLSITPWFHSSVSIGANGLSISAGIDIGNTSHDFTVGIGLAPLVVLAGLALIVFSGGTAINSVLDWFSKIFSFGR